MEYDLIIAGGSVIDGSGADAITADIAISDGRINALATCPEQRQKTHWMLRAKSSPRVSLIYTPTWMPRLVGTP